MVVIRLSNKAYKRLKILTFLFLLLKTVFMIAIKIGNQKLSVYQLVKALTLWTGPLASSIKFVRSFLCLDLSRRITCLFPFHSCEGSEVLLLETALFSRTTVFWSIVSFPSLPYIPQPSIESGTHFTAGLTGEDVHCAIQGWNQVASSLLGLVAGAFYPLGYRF